MARASIAVVVPYFGPPPLWMPAFLHSCRFNPDVHWLIYGDMEPTFPVPDNVFIRPMQLREFNERASNALGATVAIDPAGLRKICDFKPLYGLMFADALAAYAWWAFSDLDIVWGDIRRFMTDELLDAHDIVSSRDGKVAGPFSLFRNIESVNRVFEGIPDVATLLRSPQYLHIDEKVITRRLRDLRDKMRAEVPRFYWQQELTVSADYQRQLPDDASGQLWWRQGRTFDAQQQELMYLHFHKLKITMTAMGFGFDERPASFCINRRGVFLQPDMVAVGV